MSIYLLDAHAIGNITDDLDEFDKVALRCASTMLHSQLKFEATRAAPHKICKRAILCGNPRMVAEARAAGARDLMRYAQPGTSLEVCADAWNRDFVFENIIARVASRDKWIAELRRYPHDALMHSIILEKAIMSIGVMPRNDIRAIIEQLARLYCSGIRCALKVIDAIIIGCAKYGRVDIAIEELGVRSAICDVSKLRVEYDHYFVRSGSIKLCEMARGSIMVCQGMFLEEAARSGSRAMCEYVRGRCERTLDVGRMIRGAIKAENVEMFILARQWIDRYDYCVACRDGSYYPTRDINLVGLSGDMLAYAVNAGSRKMCEYMRAWNFEMRAKYASELRIANMASERAILGFHSAWDKIQEELRISWRSQPRYDDLFGNAIHHKWYWIADLMYQWAHESIQECNLSLLTDLDGQVISKTANLAIRGRIARDAASIT